MSVDEWSASLGVGTLLIVALLQQQEQGLYYGRHGSSPEVRLNGVVTIQHPTAG